MPRTFLALALLLAVAADASAQTAPSRSATTQTTTAHSMKPARRTTIHKSTVKSAAKPAPVAGTRSDIGPGGNGAAGSTESADGKGQSVYAAPGEPINVPSGKVGPYDGKAAGRHTTKNGNTLAPR